jgi:adenosylmethionine-8-amino-7-oxononanoate aminotransferase
MTRETSSALIFRDLEREYPLIERGEGIYLFDETGKRYIDGASGSAAVTNIGHGVEEVIQAIETACRKLAYCPTHYFANRPAIELAELVATITPPGLDRVWLVSDGSEATENAIKLARQFQIERGQSSKFLVVCRWQAYHGATLASLGYGGHTFRRRMYTPLFQNSPHIPPAYCYRCYFEKEYPQCGLLCALALEKMISPDYAAALQESN